MINRLEWLKAVLQAEVTDRAKGLASALAIQFDNDQTGQINPGLDTLCACLRMGEDTVRRAIADLPSGGWLGRILGRGRDNKSVFVLLSPDIVVARRPVRNAEQAAPKRSRNCGSPCKAEHSSEQKAGARPAAHLAVLVESGGWKALDWNTWLSDQGLMPHFPAPMCRNTAHRPAFRQMTARRSSLPTPAPSMESAGPFQPDVLPAFQPQRTGERGKPRPAGDGG